MLGDGWHNLSRATAVSYDGDALASVVTHVVPFCSVEDLASEGVQSWKMNFPWRGKAPYGSQQDGALSRQPLFSHRVNELDFPPLFLRQPSCASASKV